MRAPARSANAGCPSPARGGRLCPGASFRSAPRVPRRLARPGAYRWRGVGWALVLCAAAVWALAGCGDGGGPPQATASRPAVTPAQTHLFALRMLEAPAGGTSTPEHNPMASAAADAVVLQDARAASTAVQLSSFSVVPAQLTLPLGHTVFLNAVGILPDGSQVTRTSGSHWIVQGDPIGKVSPIGGLKAVAPGVAIVTAEDYVSGMSGYCIVTVPPAK